MIDPRNRFAIAGGDDDALHRWELPSGRELPPLPGHTDSIWSVDISADGAHAATASSDGSARLWSTANWSSVPLRGPDGPVRSVAFSPDGTQLATGHDRGAILIWDVATGHLVRRLGELEAGDGGTCDELAHASWHDEVERDIVARACGEPDGAGFDRVSHRAHLDLVGVDLVERW
jgi:WD40 repeat protein